MILIIDNYDSFVETLARYVREAGYEVQVIRNDTVTAEEAGSLNPQGVVISPGPYTPEEAGVSRQIAPALPMVPILGVCLGHLAIAEAYGGQTVQANVPMHGRASAIKHDSSALFTGMPQPFEGGRYHALVADIDGTDLIPSAYSSDGELMAFRHAERPHLGVQFHPESVLTGSGRRLINNFLEMCQ